MSPKAPTPDTQTALSEVFQEAFTSTRNSQWYTALYVLLAVALYFGSRHLYDLFTASAPSLLVVATALQLVSGVAAFGLALHAVARWQAYKQVFQALAKAAPQVPSSLQDWFYSQVYGLANSCTEGFRSMWDPSLYATACLLVGTGATFFVSVVSLALGMDYTWFQALGLFSLVLTLMGVELALLPRVRVPEKSPAALLYDKTSRYFEHKSHGTPPTREALQVRVPLRLRGHSFWELTAAVALCLTLVASYELHTNAQEKAIDNAFVQALTAPRQGGALAQAQAARQVATRPRIWNADGVRVVPRQDLAGRLQATCFRVSVGHSTLPQGFFVCGDSFTSEQRQLIRGWARQAKPQAALALETVAFGLRDLTLPDSH